MPYCMRLMCKEDIVQVAEIDREAFSTTWPPIDYRRELRNQIARYIVICKEEETVEEPEAEDISETGFPYLVSRVRQLFNYTSSFGHKPSPSDGQCLIGFAGLWMMAEEAHVINIAVRGLNRRRGIGELLLIAMIDLALEMKAEIITLEVRASNLAARRLYSKYGFTRVGLRRGYYTDTGEDGVLMSTEKIALNSFQTRFQQLKEAHSRKWGIALYQLTGTGSAQPDSR